MKLIEVIGTANSTIHKSLRMNEESAIQRHSQNIELLHGLTDLAIVTQSPRNVERADKMKSMPIAPNQMPNPN
jgi:hypothetical protein